MKTCRIVDINGDPIAMPEHYYECFNEGIKMIDKMEENGVDRSDMHVILNYLQTEFLFHTKIFGKRELNKSKKSQTSP